MNERCAKRANRENIILFMHLWMMRKNDNSGGIRETERQRRDRKLGDRDRAHPIRWYCSSVCARAKQTKCNVIAMFCFFCFAGNMNCMKMCNEKWIKTQIHKKCNNITKHNQTLATRIARRASKRAERKFKIIWKWIERVVLFFLLASLSARCLFCYFAVLYFVPLCAFFSHCYLFSCFLCCFFFL